jgi:hypothetical protein
MEGMAMNAWLSEFEPMENAVTGLSRAPTG